MKKLYFIVMLIFGRQNHFKKNKKLNQLETEIVLEDKKIKNNILLAKKNLILNKTYDRFPKILICMFLCFVVFYFIYLAVKKYQLKREKEQLEAREKEAKEEEERNKKYFLKILRNGRVSLFCKKAGKKFDLTGSFFNKLIGSREWQKACTVIIKEKGFEEDGISVIEIDYNRILKTVKKKNICFFFYNSVYFFENEKLQKIHISEFKEKKEKIKNLNAFCLNDNIIRQFVDFFYEKISEKMKILKEKLNSFNSIEELILKTLEIFPTRTEVNSLQVQYKFSDMFVDSLTVFLFYKHRTTRVFCSFVSFMDHTFYYISEKYNKSLSIKIEEELGENNQTPIEVPNERIELAKERLKNLCFLFHEPSIESSMLYTCFGHKTISNETYEHNISKQEEKTVRYLEQKYPGNQTYYLSWDDIIDFLEHCLLNETEIDNQI